MNSIPRPREPSGADLLAGTPEAVEHCRRLIPAAFPDGLPSPELAARAAGAIWRHLREHPDTEPVAWDPSTATTSGSAPPSSATGWWPPSPRRRATPWPGPSRIRVTAYSEEFLP